MSENPSEKKSINYSLSEGLPRATKNESRLPIINVLWHLKKNGFAETTLKGISKRLRLLSEKCDLRNPESVKNFIVNLHTTNEYKINLVNTYDHYAKYYQIRWEKPKYRRSGSLRKIPLEQNVNFIIEKVPLKRRVAFTLIKEYGLRPIEISNLTLKDIDLEQGIIYVKTAKYGNPREFKIKPKTLAMLNLLIGKIKPALNQRIFGRSDVLNRNWRRERYKAYVEMGNPEFLKIRLYDLRHFFATMLYHHTKDILFVMRKLGHKNVQNTMVYTCLVNFESDEYTCRVAKDLQEACRLIEAGFEYVTEMEGTKIFRKRK